MPTGGANAPKWGQESVTWTKAREMGEFRLKRVTEADIRGKASYVLVATDGRAFSAGKDTTIGKKIGIFGLPPVSTSERDGWYTVRKFDSAGSSTGYGLELVPIDPPSRSPAPAAPAANAGTAGSDPKASGAPTSS